jgi:hypothetical protein
MLKGLRKVWKERKEISVCLVLFFSVLSEVSASVLDEIRNFTGINVIVFFVLIVISLGGIAGLLFVIARFLNSVKSLKGKLPNGVEFSVGTLVSPGDSVSLPKAPKVVELETVESHEDDMDFYKHNLFLLLKRVKLMGAEVRCESKIKAVVASEFLKLYADSMLRHLKEWVESVVASDGAKISEIDVVKMNITKEYMSMAARQKVIVPYNNKSYVLDGFPEIFLRKFEIFHTPHLSTLIDQVLDVVSSMFHRDWRIKLISILDIFEAIVRVNFVGVDTTLKYMNGELDSYFYDEVVKGGGKQ